MNTIKSTFLTVLILLLINTINAQQVGSISGETIVCQNTDIYFTLDLGFPPTSNHDEVYVRTWVLGAFGTAGGSPIDHFIYWDNLHFNKMQLIQEWDDSNGRHIKLKLQGGGSNNKIYDAISANGYIGCRFAYEWQGQGANQVTYYTAEKIFSTNKNPVARMEINDSNNTWAESHSGPNGFVADLSDSESCGEGYKIWMNKRDYWGNSLPNEPWYHQSFSGYPPSNFNLKNVGVALGLPWNPGDNYAIRLTVNGNNLWADDNHFIRIKETINISEVYSLNANESIMKAPTPWGETNYQYFENTTPTGSSVNPVIMLNGTDSEFEDGQYISVVEFDPLTWTTISTLYSGWFVAPRNIFNPNSGNILFHNHLIGPPFNINFVRGKFYKIKQAVGPQWNENNHLIKIGPWLPDEDTGNPSDRSVDAEDDLMFEIWPNPSQGLVNIKNLEDIKTFKLEVYNLTGQKLLQKEYKEEDQSIADLSNLPKGAYIISVITSKKRQAQKLILH